MAVTIDQLRALLIDFDFADTMLVAAKNPGTVYCELCPDVEKVLAHAIVSWRYEVEPTEPEPYRTDEIAACIDCVLPAMHIAHNTDGFCAAEVEVLP